MASKYLVSIDLFLGISKTALVNEGFSATGSLSSPCQSWDSDTAALRPGAVLGAEPDDEATWPT